MDETKILIIEDEQKIADTLKYGLIENGYMAEAAYTGKAALQLFSRNVYQLLLLDINLPDINGFDLCKMIRSENEQVPIIMLTALNSINHKLEGYETGADDYIPKPFEFKELLMKIKVLVKRTNQQEKSASNVLKADDLEMNLDSKSVTRNNKVIGLTAKEFQLLEYLLKNRNRVLSRADIAVNVWDIDFDTNTNVIDVYINYLRNKIDKNFQHKLIHTQIGMGYVLRDNS
jgi:two-component system, OmpR family, copper resistance phosphate regulon response regulator CusR